MLLLNFCLRSVVMNAMRFLILQTTSKIVLALLFLRSKLREFDLALPEKKRSINSIKISLIQTKFDCKHL